MSTAQLPGLTPHQGRHAVPAVGVEIGAAIVRAVVVRRGVICWTAARPWAMRSDAATSGTADEAPDESLATALATVLCDARAAAWASRPRWQRRLPQRVARAPAVYVALSPRLVQFKRLAGFAPTIDARQAAAAVRANVGQFFLANGTPLVTGGVRWVDATVVTRHVRPTAAARRDDVGEGREAWVAAYPTPAIATVVCACARARLRLAGIGPVPAVLGAALATVPHAAPATTGDAALTEAPHALWEDAGVRVALWVDPTTRRVDRVQRTPSLTSGVVSHMPGGSPPPWHSALEAIGPDSAEFAAAFGAASVANRPNVIDPVSLRFTRRGERTIIAAQRRADATRAGASPPPVRTVPRWRLALAGAACAAGLMAASATPGLSARRDARRAGAALRALGPRRAEAMIVTADLARASDVLRQAGREGVSGVAPLALLAAVARVLPDGSALVDVQYDSREGRLVALAPHAAAVLSGLARVPELDALEIVSPVTREPMPVAGAVASGPLPNGIAGISPASYQGPVTSLTPPSAGPIAPTMIERVAVRFRMRASAFADGRLTVPTR